MEDLRKFREQEFRLIYGGLIAISLIILQDLISIKMDTATNIAMISFCISTPLLVFAILNEHHMSISEKNLPVFADKLAEIGTYTAVIGVTSAIWHATWIGSIAFLISGLVGFATYLRHLSEVRKEMQEKLQQRSR